jgi:Zn-dependent protease with chaperone function
MIKLRGYWYNGQSSARMPCELQVDQSGNMVVLDEGGNRLYAGMFHHLEVSSRLGNTPRFINFPQGQRLETADNDLVDQLLAEHHPRSHNGWLHKLESRKRFVLATLITVLAFIWMIVQYGAPVVAKAGAAWIPQKAVRIIGKQALGALDKAYFQPSRLPVDVRDRIKAHFSSAMADHPQLSLRVVFRYGGELGPNAFALPDGTVVFTDAMVKLAKDDDELLAVFAHEIGHVKYRHSMQRLIQDSTLAFLLSVIAGDISGTSEVFLGIPIFLTELGYSRKFEREADAYAFDYLRRTGKSTLHFANLMHRLEQSVTCKDKDEICKKRAKNSSKWSNYLSSHPPTDERINKAQAAQ